MRIGIIGAGMLGAHVGRELLDAGHQVSLFDRSPDPDYLATVLEADVRVEQGDVTDPATVMTFLAANRIDAVVHTVGLIGGLAQQAPSKAFRVNVEGTAHVAEACGAQSIPRLIYISTQGVYDNSRCVDEPISESAPVSSKRVYPATKLAAEHVLEAYSNAAGPTTLSFRVANVYGRGQYLAGSYVGEAFNALVAPAARAERGAILPGVRGQAEWVYSKDVARAVRLGIEAELDPGYDVVNIGTGILSDEKDLISAVLATCPEATFDEGDTGNLPALIQRHQPSDLSFASALLGYSPQWDLRAGVHDYINDIRRVSG